MIPKLKKRYIYKKKKEDLLTVADHKEHRDKLKLFVRHLLQDTEYRS